MLNVSGHLLSTAQVESAIIEHKAVAEAAAVSSPHPIKGECIYCFIVLKNGFHYNADIELSIKDRGKCSCLCVLQQQSNNMSSTKSSRKDRRPGCARDCSPGVGTAQDAVGQDNASHSGQGDAQRHRPGRHLHHGGRINTRGAFHHQTPVRSLPDAMSSSGSTQQPRSNLISSRAALSLTATVELICIFIYIKVNN